MKKLSLKSDGNTEVQRFSSRNKIQCSNEDETYIGEVIGRQDIFVFDSKTKDELEKSFHLVVEDYLVYCLKNAKPSNRAEERIGIKGKRQ